MKRALLIQCITCLLSVLFVYTGASKLLSLHAFAATLSHIHVLQGIAPVLAVLIVGAELLLGVLLLTVRYRFAALLGALLLMVGFTVFIGVLMLSGSHLPCSCGGVISSMSWGQHLVFNLFFIAIAAIAIKLCMHQTGEAENLQNRVGKS